MVRPADAARPSRSLVLNGQRSGETENRWCENAAGGLRLLVGDRYLRPPCKRRDCGRCWARRSRELARCLVLDAEREMPTLALTLTTRDPDTPAALYREGSAQLWRALRAELGRVEYFGAVEFTTGRAALSGGRRRQHGHHLIKGPDGELAAEVEAIAREVWLRVVGAWRVEAAALRSPGAALGYLGLHHRKPEQAPPIEWRGMTERASRGYWHRPIPELRKTARRQLAAAAQAWARGEVLATADDVELAEIEAHLRAPAELRRVREGVVLVPLGPVHREASAPVEVAGA